MGLKMDPGCSEQERVLFCCFLLKGVMHHNPQHHLVTVRLLRVTPLQSLSLDPTASDHWISLSPLPVLPLAPDSKPVWSKLGQSLTAGEPE